MSFVGKYERVSAENYDGFLETLGVNAMLRKAASVSTPTMKVNIYVYFNFLQAVFPHFFEQIGERGRWCLDHQNINNVEIN